LNNLKNGENNQKINADARHHHKIPQIRVVTRPKDLVDEQSSFLILIRSSRKEKGCLDRAPRPQKSVFQPSSSFRFHERNREDWAKEGASHASWEVAVHSWLRISCPDEHSTQDVFL